MGKKSHGGTNPFMENFKNKQPRFIKVEVEGQGYRWVDANKVQGLPPYDPETIKMGGAKVFTDFIHQCLHGKGIGVSPGNYFEWDMRTYDKFYCDVNEPETFPFTEPGPGRFVVPVYFFMITAIDGKPFDWACYAEVEKVLRGYLTRHQDFWLEEYGRQIQKGILDKWKPGNKEE